MPRWARYTGPALLVFATVALVANLPWLEGWVHGLSGQHAVDLVESALAVVMLTSLLIGTLGAAVHYRRNAELSGGRRTMWYALLFLPAIGALSYYLVVMRGRNTSR